VIHVQKELDLGENPFDPGSIMAARSSSGGVLETAKKFNDTELQKRN
jgi:hypothetical protein